MTETATQPLFRPLCAEEGEEPEVTEIESLCMNCHANGITRLLLTRIPYYKNVVVMSFSCEECGYQNNELQPGGTFAEKGVRWTVRVEDSGDLNRQVVKSDYTSVRIPELDFEIPARSQNGEVTTVEGIVSRAIRGLTQQQAERRAQHPRDADLIEQFVARLAELQLAARPWTLQLEDVSGNCFVENPEAPHRDPRATREEFHRNEEQDRMLGIYTEIQQENRTSDQHLLMAAPTDAMPYEQLAADDILTFRTNCPDCGAPADTNMKLTKIPHFKEVVIMSTTCDACGHRTNEVKSGGGIEERGVRFEVRVASREDFSRDILKSETCSMEIPELELEVGGRALGGRFTTAEGLLRATAAQLAACPGAGDAAGAGRRLQAFLARLDRVLAAAEPVTLVLDDPAGNSYVQSLAPDPDLPDDGLKITRYERSFEQNEDLGLNDMNTEHYQAPDACQTAPDVRQTAPDARQTAPDARQTAPDARQTAPDARQTAPDARQTPTDAAA